MKCTLLKVFLALLIAFSSRLVHAQKGCENLPNERHFGKTKIVVALDYLSGIPENELPFDRWFYLQKKVPSGIRITEVILSDTVKAGQELLCFEQAPMKDAEGYDVVNILVPPLKPNTTRRLVFVTNMDDIRKQQFFDIFLNLSENKPDSTLNLYSMYGREGQNLFSQPGIRDLKNYYDEHLKLKIAEYEAESNAYSKGLIRQEVFEIFDHAPLTTIPTPRSPAFDSKLLSDEMYVKRLTNALIDYYLGNAEAAFKRFRNLPSSKNTSWGNFENFVKNQLKPLLTATDSTNIVSSPLNSASILTTIREKAVGNDQSFPWEKLAAYIDGEIQQYSTLTNISPCLIWDKVREDIHNKARSNDTAMPWAMAEQFINTAFADYTSVGCPAYGQTREIIYNLVKVNEGIETANSVDLFKMASIDGLGVQDFEIKTRNSYRLVPDFGYVVYGFRPGKFFGGTPYFGLAYNMRSFDPDVPLRKIKDLKYWEYLSFNAAITFSSLREDNSRDNLMRRGNFLTGIGVRVNHTLKLNAGTIWYNKLSGDPLADRRKIRPVLYLGVSIDFRLQQLLDDMASIFSRPGRAVTATPPPN